MAKTFFVEIVALGGHVFKGDVLSLQAPGVGGSFQILRNHAPMLSALEVGLIDIKDENGEENDAEEERDDFLADVVAYDDGTVSR